MAGMDDWSPVETTLDEPVSETIRRDLREVGAKLKLVLLPRASQHGVLDRLKEWDLWGPLAVCLTLSIALSAGAPESQRALVFAAVFVVVMSCVEINQCVGYTVSRRWRGHAVIFLLPHRSGRARPSSR